MLPNVPSLVDNAYGHVRIAVCIFVRQGAGIKDPSWHFVMENKDTHKGVIIKKLIGLNIIQIKTMKAMRALMAPFSKILGKHI